MNVCLSEVLVTQNNRKKAVSEEINREEPINRRVELNGAEKISDNPREEQIRMIDEKS